MVTCSNVSVTEHTLDKEESDASFQDTNLPFSLISSNLGIRRYQNESYSDSGDDVLRYDDVIA
eukprot:scaffold142346_cov55-Attheya_sp.AAC.1